MDMVKCVGGHEMLKVKKFCGECGKGQAEPETTLVKCRACEGQFMKGANFCSDCGTATSAAEDLDAELEKLGEFVKANAARVAELTALPELDEEEIGTAATATATEMLKSATLKDAEGKALVDANGIPEMNATPIVVEMIKSVGALAAQTRAYAEHTLAFQGHVAHGQDLLIKAALSIGATVKHLRDDIAAYGAGSRGTAGAVRRPLALVDKAAPGGATTAERDLRGPALMAKAQTILGDELAGLAPEEAALLDTYTNGMNLSLDEIAKERPLLATSITRAFEAKRAS